MTQCPFKNILDPDIYVGGGHHEIFAEIREQSGGLAYIEDPITGVPYWAVMKRDMADYVCRNPLLFSSYAKAILPKEVPEEEIALSRLMLVNMDPPEHVKYRRIVRNAFTPKAVQGYEERFRDVARHTIDRVASQGSSEFVTDVAAELPLVAILSLCGIPMEDKQQLKVGDKMVINWQAINHDPDIFEDPVTFDVERFRTSPELVGRHRAFGNGEHFCIGAHMSRLEMQVMFEECIPRLRNPRFAQPVEYVRDYFVNSIKAMQIRFDPELPKAL